jgi:hypothetical protein
MWPVHDWLITWDDHEDKRMICWWLFGDSGVMCCRGDKCWMRMKGVKNIDEGRGNAMCGVLLLQFLEQYSQGGMITGSQANGQCILFYLGTHT